MKSRFDNNFYKYISEAKEYDDSRLIDLKSQYEGKEQITMQDIADLLNVAIADEFLAAFNYFSSFILSKTEGKEDFDPEFEAHYEEELEHARKIADRLNEMSMPAMTMKLEDYLTLNSAGSSWVQQTEQPSIVILQNRRDEEVGAISFYKFVLHLIDRMKAESGYWDSTTEMLVKQILADEEEHLYDLNKLLAQYEKPTTSIQQGE